MNFNDIYDMFDKYTTEKCVVPHKITKGQLKDFLILKNKSDRYVFVSLLVLSQAITRLKR